MMADAEDVSSAFVVPSSTDVPATPLRQCSTPREPAPLTDLCRVDY
jgi:hypothetical protein